MKPSALLDDPMPGFEKHRLPVCARLECVYAIRKQDGEIYFVHDGGGRYSMYHCPSEHLDDVQRNIWGDDVVPWIDSLHEESV